MEITKSRWFWQDDREAKESDIDSEMLDTSMNVESSSRVDYQIVAIL
jgi:hypothetical protein